METFIDRLKKERDELKERYDKLHAFIGSAKFNAISHTQQVMLVDQRYYMMMYLSILNSRLKDLTKGENK